MELNSIVSGQGPEIVFIHGGMTDGPLAWCEQKSLTDAWTLRILDRAGYGESAALSAGEDIELDAQLLAASLDGPVHLVGHSSGGIVALITAATAPRLVRSLAIIEPPSYRFVDDPEIVALAEFGEVLFTQEQSVPDEEWMAKFFVGFGEDPPSQETIQLLLPHVGAFRQFVRLPWQIDLPIAAIKSAAFPSLVISGGHHKSFERLNDHIADSIGARRAVVEGAGHEVQATGAPFNRVLAEFITEAERNSHSLGR